MYTATQDNDIHFNQLHKEDQSRVRYKKSCAHCGKELKTEDIIKGYEYDKDHYIVVSDEEIDKIKTKKGKSIQIMHFAQLNQISPVYYDKTCQAVPDKGGEKAFELLRSALIKEQKMAQVLINSIYTPFDPSQYQDEYQGKLKELIETKIAGKEVVAAGPEQAGKVINLMDALKASIEKQYDGKENQPETKRENKKKGA